MELLNPVVDRREVSHTADALDEAAKTVGRPDIAVVCLYAAGVLRNLIADTPPLSDDWEPTAENINALPTPVRAYIQALARGLGRPM